MLSICEWYELWGLVSIYLKSLFPPNISTWNPKLITGVKTIFKFGEYRVSRSPWRKLRSRFAHINFYFSLVRKKLHARCNLTCSGKKLFVLKYSLKVFTTPYESQTFSEVYKNMVESSVRKFWKWRKFFSWEILHAVLKF